MALNLSALNNSNVSVTALQNAATYQGITPQQKQAFDKLISGGDSNADNKISKAEADKLKLTLTGVDQQNLFLHKQGTRYASTFEAQYNALSGGGLGASSHSQHPQSSYGERNLASNTSATPGQSPVDSRNAFILKALENPQVTPQARNFYINLMGGPEAYQAALDKQNKAEGVQANSKPLTLEQRAEQFIPKTTLDAMPDSISVADLIASVKQRQSDSSARDAVISYLTRADLNNDGILTKEEFLTRQVNNYEALRDMGLPTLPGVSGGTIASVRMGGIMRGSAMDFILAGRQQGQSA